MALVGHDNGHEIITTDQAPQRTRFNDHIIAHLNTVTLHKRHQTWHRLWIEQPEEVPATPEKRTERLRLRLQQVAPWPCHDHHRSIIRHLRLARQYQFLDGIVL